MKKYANIGKGLLLYVGIVALLYGTARVTLGEQTNVDYGRLPREEETQGSSFI